jgi:hypothetical protein
MVGLEISIDLHKKRLSSGKFMLGGHLDLVRHFVFFGFILFTDLNY